MWKPLFPNGKINSFGTGRTSPLGVSWKYWHYWPCFLKTGGGLFLLPRWPFLRAVDRENGKAERGWKKVGNIKCKSVVNQVLDAWQWRGTVSRWQFPPLPPQLDKRRSCAPPRGANCVWSKQVPGSNRGELRCSLVLPWGCSCSAATLLPFPFTFPFSPFGSISFQPDMFHFFVTTCEQFDPSKYYITDYKSSSKTFRSQLWNFMFQCMNEQYTKYIINSCYTINHG